MTFLIPDKYYKIYTNKNQAIQILEILLNYSVNNNIVTDCSACIGGNSVYFLSNYKHVDIIEKDKETHDVLVKNTSRFKNKTIYNCSYNILKFMLKQDVIFIDPPWGGLNYKNSKNVDLYLDNVNVLDIINELYNFCKVVCLKVPNNYNFDSLSSDFWENKVHNIYKNKIVIYKIIIFYKK